MFKKNTKKAFLMSVLALMLCISMFVGSTFAWFTDSVSSVNNIIKSGNLDIEVTYTLDGDNWLPLAEDASIFSESDLWEPGHTVVGALQIKNVGSLAAKLDVVTTVFSEDLSINVYGNEFKLSDYLKVYTGTDASAIDFDDRASFAAAGLTESAFGASLFTSDDTDILESGETQDVVIAITMPTTVGNEANHKTGVSAPQIKFGIAVYAAQQMFEEDSFGNDYDKDATFGDYPQAAVQVNGPQTITSEQLSSSFPGPKGQIELDATYTFVAPAGETEYDDWYADYEVSVTGADPAVLTAEGNLPAAAIIMSGQYNANSAAWQSFYTPEVALDTPYMLLRDAAGAKLDYATIRDWIGTFNCGVKKNTEAASGATINVALVLYKEDANGNIIDKKVVSEISYTF